MMDATKVLLEQFTRNLKKQPGWVPLLMLIYLLTAFPPINTILGDKHGQIFVVLATFLLYQLGDSFDKAIYARRSGSGILHRAISGISA
jgi:hypothetical protein